MSVRELKDFELKMVAGGRVETSGITQTAPTFDINKTYGSALAEPFLWGDPTSPKNLAKHIPTPKPSRVQRNLPNTLTKQPHQGGPFTFKTPYLNR